MSINHRAAGRDSKHIYKECYLKEEEENTTSNLTVVNITEAKDNKGNLNSPIALDKGRNNVYKAIFNTDSKVLYEIPKRNEYSCKPSGDRTEEFLCIVKESLKLIQFQIF